MSFQDYQTSNGYIYVRVRAISSRVNLNHDGWPAAELKKAYRTFIGKPIFVDHHNHDPKKARGVVVDAELHQEDQKTSALDPYYSSPDVDPEHLPATWIELLLEIDAKRYPKFARAFVSGDIDSVSMGADVQYTLCSHCSNRAEDPSQFCKHILSKGAHFDYYKADGTKTSKRSYENCYDITYFELSGVFTPADQTALALDIKTASMSKPRDLKTLAKESGFLDDPDMEDFDPGEAPVGYGDESEDALGLHNRVDESERVKRNRYDRLIAMGYPPELAEEIAGQEYRGPGSGVDIHELENLIGRGAAPETAYGIVARRKSATRKQAEAPVPRKQAEAPVPQSEMTKMPQSVDTLRQESVCSVCGSTMQDGECQLCGYTEPPEGFDNPDLQKAQEVDKQLHDNNPALDNPGESMDQANMVSPDAGMPASSGMANGPVMSKYVVARINPNGSLSVKNKTAATQPVPRINTAERPLLPAGRSNTDKPLAVRPVANPTRPLESNILKLRTKDNMPEIKTADGATPWGNGTQAEKRVELLDVGGVSGDPLSGIESQDVAKDTGDFVAPHTKTWGPGDGDSLGQHDPVTDEAFVGAEQGSGNAASDTPGATASEYVSAYRFACDNKDCSDEHPCDDCKKHHSSLRVANKYIKERDGKWVIIQKGTGKVLSTHDSKEKAEAAFRAMEMNKHGAEGPAGLGGPIGDAASIPEGTAADHGNSNDKGSAPGFPDHEPAHIDLNAPLREEIGDRTMTWTEGDSTTWSTNPVTKGEEYDVNNVGGPIGVRASSFNFAMKAMKLAEAEAQLGMVANKWQRLAELEQKSDEYVDAQLEAIKKFHTASARRTASRKTAGVGRMPSLRHAAFDPEALADHPVGTEDSLTW
ncbi:MAG: hypothetical protein KGL39_42125 [Patescibacteria group bacterium]|nr:hypothetical protein [Patescibacteria group bacterium]